MLTLQFIPHSEIHQLTSEQRVKKLLRIVKNESIILLEGKLKSREEAELIRRTMESIDKKFKGIEIGTITPKKINKFKQGLMKVLFKEESGFTIIGPATIIKEIKQDPGKIQLFAMGVKTKSKSKR